MLSSTTLKDRLLEVGLQSSETAARAAWAYAYRKYFETAAAGPVPVIPSALDTPETAMSGAMVGLSTSGAAAIQSGVVAFWGALFAAGTFAGATAITPPVGITSLSSALTAVFLSNTAGSKSAEDSYGDIANAIHTASSGGIAVYPVPPTGIGPQTIV